MNYHTALDVSLRFVCIYVSSEIHFTLAVEPWGRSNWRTIVDIETGSILYLSALVDNVDGLIFAADPFSQGSPAADPTSNNTTLNPLRSNVLLPGLDAPVTGAQVLTGEFVAMTDHETPDVDPPAENTGTDFDYNARSNDFAAVNYYYHCDGFFRLVEDLGFPVTTYIDGTSFPVTIDHRGRFLSGDGIWIKYTSVRRFDANPVKPHIVAESECEEEKQIRCFLNQAEQDYLFLGLACLKCPIQKHFQGERDI